MKVECGKGGKPRVAPVLREYEQPNGKNQSINPSEMDKKESYVKNSLPTSKKLSAGSI
ncbi:hypothetical protein ASZ90_019457 [hydrocarbon metagenome]|uniref:Uncharacterized protein n=1 Tax=hydrocarbon metagenome TaxID=938273 RepID=A0A0W8E3U5_9ZZZZ